MAFPDVFHLEELEKLQLEGALSLPVYWDEKFPAPVVLRFYLWIHNRGFLTLVFYSEATSPGFYDNWFYFSSFSPGFLW